MALHDELLNLAIRLVGPPLPVPSSPLPAPTVIPAIPGPLVPATAALVAPTNPVVPPVPEAELRRAVSTAYYALFHLLIDASITRGVPAVDLRPYVVRNFEHRHMLAVCRRYSGLAVDLTGLPVPTEIQRIADAFVQLQNARHKADYNVKDSVTPGEAHRRNQGALKGGVGIITIRQ